MTELHSLLKRQLRRYTSDTKPFLEDHSELLQMISDAYWQFDADRGMLEHSLELTSQELLERNAELTRTNTELEMRVAARTAELSRNEARFRGLFEYAPVSIWEEDFSAVRQYIDNLGGAGVIDFSAYFAEHPEDLAECARRVKIVDVNRATLEMYQAESKAQLLADLSLVLGPESLTAFKEELLALIRGDMIFETELFNYTLRGERRIVFLRLTVAPGFEQTWEKVFVGISDITERRQAEAKLEQSETLFRALFDLSPDAVLVIDPYDPDVSWPIIDCNMVACLINGYAREELIGHSIDILNLTRGTEDERIAYLKQLREAGHLKLETNHRRKNGVMFPVEVSTTLITVGERELVIGIDRDITERKRTEEALHESQERFRSLSEAAFEGIMIHDRGIILNANQAFADLFGFHSPDELIGRNGLEILPLTAESREKIKSNIERSLPEASEIEVVGRDGSTFPAETQGRNIIYQGRKVRVVAMRDITARKRAEEALQQSEERFRLMAWATTDAVWDWDLQKNQIWWGSGLQKIFHYSSDKDQTDPEWWRSHIHPEDRAKVDRTINQALEVGIEFWSKEYRFQRVNGTYADIMDRGYIIHDDTGKPYRMIGAMMDITERKQSEAALQEANEEMARSLNELAVRNHEIALLNEMSDLLQASRSFRAAHTIIGDAARQLFPGTMGALYLFNTERTLVNSVVSWGDPPPAAQTFAPDDCWALRRGQTRQLYEEDAKPLCRHLFEAPPVVSYCLPMVAQNEILGVLHLQSPSKDNLTEPKRQLAYTVVEQAGMALSNLKLREALREQSIRDPLTGLYNRRYMEEVLKQQLSRVTRHLHPLGIIMIDIDHFKLFNDTHGHATGDALLRELSRFLQSHIRGEDVACRYGGEEFILIMPDASLETARQRAEHLRQTAKGVHVHDAGQSLGGITLSLGVAIYPQHGHNIETVMRAADAALYRAKQEGRDRVVVAEKAD